MSHGLVHQPLFRIVETNDHLVRLIERYDFGFIKSDVEGEHFVVELNDPPIELILVNHEFIIVYHKNKLD